MQTTINPELSAIRAAVGRIGGSVRSRKKKRACRLNGAAPPRPGSRPRGRPPKAHTTALAVSEPPEAAAPMPEAPSAAFSIVWKDTTASATADTAESAYTLIAAKTGIPLSELCLADDDGAILVWLSEAAADADEPPFATIKQNP